MIFIAEVKTQSPFGWKSNRSWDYLFDIADEIGDWISIHTDPRWGGSFDLINKAKRKTKKPILAKGLHVSDEDVKIAFDCGADYVLVVGRITDTKNVLIEPLNIELIKHIPHNCKLVWNTRDLLTGNRKAESFSTIRNMWPGWLCQASFVKFSEDINAGADAVIVGENLENFHE